MLIMDSSSVPRRQVLMSTSSQAPPFPNPSMLQMPLVPQYCLGPGAAYPPYGYVAARVPFHGQPSTAGSPPNGVAGHSTSSASSTSSSCSAAPNPSINRSQRCGVCRGCQCKPCGLCTYCQDSPQFGGPGVKKQSCIERRCLRVLENRLQRDAPTFKARMGCNNCDDCRAPDCQICLVCLDKRFFNKYMCGAMCAKKRCNNATSLELPYAQQAQQLANSVDRNQLQQQQQVLKRSYENAHFEHMIAKRRGLEMQMQQQIQHQQQLQQQQQDQLISPSKQMAAAPPTKSLATANHQQPPSHSSPETSPSPCSNGSSPGSIANPGKMVLSEEQQQLGNNASGSALTTQFQPSNFNGSTAPHTTCFEPILRVENASSNIISSQSMSTPSRPLPIANSISQSVQAVMDGNMPTYNHLQPTLTAPFLPPTTTAPMSSFEGGRQVIYQSHQPLPPLAIGANVQAQQLPQHQFQTYHQYQQRFLNYPKYEYYEEDQQHHPLHHHHIGPHIYDTNQPDLFVPPSYSELKNGVVLQPL